MKQDSSNPPQFSAEQIRQVLTSPEGKQLIALLNRDGGQQLRQAAEAFRRGDMAQVQALMQPLTQDREAAELLKKINGR